MQPFLIRLIYDIPGIPSWSLVAKIDVIDIQWNDHTMENIVLCLSLQVLPMKLIIVHLK